MSCKLFNKAFFSIILKLDFNLLFFCKCLHTNAPKRKLFSISLTFPKILLLHHLNDKSSQLALLSDKIQQIKIHIRKTNPKTFTLEKLALKILIYNFQLAFSY